MTMRKQIVFATNNRHKLDEIRDIAGTCFEILSLADIGCHDDIPETADTLRGNALLKARWVKDRYGYDCFADDTGLMVDALDGEPGVYSARYAGPGHDSAANMALLLERMKDVVDRKARFVTEIALIEGEEEHFFTGEVKGRINDTPRGDAGFGYDPVFVPEGASVTFAEMDSQAKNAVSHRGRAVAALMVYLTQNANHTPNQ